MAKVKVKPNVEHLLANLCYQTQFELAKCLCVYWVFAVCVGL